MNPNYQDRLTTLLIMEYPALVFALEAFIRNASALNADCLNKLQQMAVRLDLYRAEGLISRKHLHAATECYYAVEAYIKRETTEAQTNMKAYEEQAENSRIRLAKLQHIAQEMKR